jgi:hypothetical protein
MPPPRVDRYVYWLDQPPEPSTRLQWWLDRITAGWRPNRRIRAMGYDESADWFGIYIWEWTNVLWPRLAEVQTPNGETPKAAAPNPPADGSQS